MSTDWDWMEEVKARLKERYTAEDLVELLGIDIDDLVEIYWDELIAISQIREEVGLNER